jgi:hypothetical protein
LPRVTSSHEKSFLPFIERPHVGFFTQKMKGSPQPEIDKSASYVLLLIEDSLFIAVKSRFWRRRSGYCKECSRSGAGAGWVFLKRKDLHALDSCW